MAHLKRSGETHPLNSGDTTTVTTAETNGKANTDGMYTPTNLKRTASNACQSSHEESAAMVQQQQAAMTLLQAQLQAKTTLTLKVSQRSAISLYGMGRFPVTLCAQEWGRFLDSADQIRQFIADNKARLSVK
jgi:hypothetical protein